MSPARCVPALPALPVPLLVPLLAAAALWGCGEVELSPRCRADTDCPKDHLCNFLNATCYPASIKDVVTLKSQVVGPFSCPYFDQPQTNIEKAGAPAAHGEFKGATYSFQIGCGIWPNNNDYELVLQASTLEPNLIAKLSLLVHGADLKAGTLTGPAKVWGWFTTLKAGQPELTRAMAWGGTVTLSKVATKAGETVEGKLDLKLEPIGNKNFGAVCRMKQTCDKTSCKGFNTLEAGSPDCKYGHYCNPFLDGTDGGYCISKCTSTPDCTSHDPKSTCYVTSTGQSYCLHSCTSVNDCEAPLTCVPTMGCLK